MATGGVSPERGGVSKEALEEMETRIVERLSERITNAIGKSSNPKPTDSGEETTEDAVDPPGRGSLGEIPKVDEAVLPTFREQESAGGVSEEEASQTARKASSLMALLNTHSAWDTPAKQSRVWLGEGLGSVSKRMFETMMKWGFVDLGEFQPRGAMDKWVSESDTEKLVVLPGFEVSQAKKKPITSIAVWCQCFARYTAAMAAKYPECAPGFMSHQVTVVKAYLEVEDPAWRLYDEAFREKVAATGTKQWRGMDVALYQEICGGQQKRLSAVGGESKGMGLGLRRGKQASEQEQLPRLCYQYNESGTCKWSKFGKKCKFAHECLNCRGNHPEFRCLGGMAPPEKRPRQ